MRVYIKPGGQRGYSGHCINLPPNVNELAYSLPRYPKDVPFVIVSMRAKGNTCKEVIVRRQKVENALQWLSLHNPQYKDIEINRDALNSLPENGTPADVVTLEANPDNVDQDSPTDTELETDSDVVYNKDTETSSFLSSEHNEKQEREAIQDELAGKTLNWPTVQNEPLNEYKTSYLATLAFPTLFPDGKGDPTIPSLNRDVPFASRIKHLLKFGEWLHDHWVYRFAEHPRFSYWALNMIQWRRILQQSSIFIKQNPGDSHLTIDQLREMASANSSALLMTKLSRYVGNILGSNAYWYKQREELKSIIAAKGVPTIFFTFSSADMHWPELHSLFSKNPNNYTNEERRQNVIHNPHIVDWFFNQRLESFIKHWLYDTLGATWHWYRYEFQARGSIHCHGTAKLKNDPGLCELTEVALKGFLAEQKFQQMSCEENHVILQDIESGKRATQTICDYLDSLLSTCNPQLPCETDWVKPSIHHVNSLI